MHERMLRAKYNNQAATQPDEKSRTRKEQENQRYTRRVLPTSFSKAS